MSKSMYQYVHKMSCDMKFPTMWNVRPAKPQISLRILSQFRHTSFLYNCLYIRFPYESYIILICKPEYMIFICAVSYEFYIIRFI